ncbi:hypothetical protein ACFWBX_26580 [Streptomyces sp. NPDC059991]|uniref:hypothetical protein n=1 Tax=Streptomyces sp. NPDC059991 TaxID=3347028 RepID=UPI0036B188E3
MADWATFAVVPEDGDHERYELYESRFGAVGLDLDLLAGPEVVLPFLRAHDRARHGWRDDTRCEGAVLVDPHRRVLLAFASDGPTTCMRHRAAALDLLRHAWPGWQLRWTYDGPAELRAYLGLDPGAVRDPRGEVYAGAALAPGDEELAEDDPLATVVTVGAGRCHLVAATADHPVAEGPALLERLDSAPEHGRCELAVLSGLHVDPARRRVGWWLLGAQAGAYEMASRWPGWTVEFWQDRWQEQTRAAGDRFAPPPADRLQALVDVRDEAREHWAGRRGAAPRGFARSVAADDSGPLLGTGFLPGVPADLTPAALLSVDSAWRGAVRAAKGTA